MAKLRHRNNEFITQLSEFRLQLSNKDQQLEESKHQYETMLRNLRDELNEVQNQADSGELSVDSAVAWLRRAELNDTTIVRILNKSFPSPAGHEFWTKFLLPKS